MLKVIDMRVEWRRGIRNYYFILMVAVNILNVLLGYILLTTIDKVEKVTFLNLCESVYTVYTQFGTLLFSSIIIGRRAKTIQRMNTCTPMQYNIFNRIFL